MFAAPSKSDETDEDDQEIDSSIEVPVFTKELHDVTASEHDTITLELKALDLRTMKRARSQKMKTNLFLKSFVEMREGDVQTYYCIEEEVGRGRFGVVKKCVELDTATRFCAKFHQSRPSQKEEFKREIDVMNVLHHPRIIRLQDAFEEPRQIILIMEYARGDDLFARIDGDSLPSLRPSKF
ncbi:hypothetical protein OS493_026223 [Desmophyllum pertusum]|uniref:Protein kinase domain-containing protein n=1 Tax=Desmophyllum pertusum TaxID=174260 RepID=A0A9W9ZMQ1_9CNID|nr:hypothetical protein OS493_026223 [Desmophyllum pertusum]